MGPLSKKLLHFPFCLSPSVDMYFGFSQPKKMIMIAAIRFVVDFIMFVFY